MGIATTFRLPFFVGATEVLSSPIACVVRVSLRALSSLIFLCQFDGAEASGGRRAAERCMSLITTLATRESLIVMRVGSEHLSRRPELSQCSRAFWYWHAGAVEDSSSGVLVGSWWCQKCH